MIVARLFLNPTAHHGLSSQTKQEIHERFEPCSKWRAKARFTSGLYSTENLGGSDFGFGEIGVCSKPELVVGVLAVASGIFSEVMRGIAGTAEPESLG